MESQEPHIYGTQTNVQQAMIAAIITSHIKDCRKMFLNKIIK